MLTPLRLLVIDCQTLEVRRIKNRTLGAAYRFPLDPSSEANHRALEHFRRHGPPTAMPSESARVFAALARQLTRLQNKYIVAD